MIKAPQVFALFLVLFGLFLFWFFPPWAQSISQRAKMLQWQVEPEIQRKGKSNASLLLRHTSLQVFFPSLLCLKVTNDSPLYLIKTSLLKVFLWFRLLESIAKCKWEAVGKTH